MLARVLEIGSDPADEPDLRIRKRTAVATVFVFMAVAVAIGVTDIALARLVPAALAFIQILAFTTSLLMFRRTRRLGPLVAAMAAIGMAILFLGLIPAGGFAQSSGDLVWILLVPLGAVLFLGGHAAAPAFGSVVVMVLAAVALDPYMRGAPQPSEEVKLVLSTINLLVPTAVALGLVLFIDGERVRAKAESDALLLNVLPRSIAERLKQGERVIADYYDEVTVLFADVVEFTPFAARETPARVVDVLNEIFSRFDTLAERYGLEKIKTIGDAYLVVAGAPEPRQDHAAATLDMALAMHATVGSAEMSAGVPIRLRTGVASGPAVAGVIGHRKFSYDIWGDAVNLASRMESTGVPGSIQLAESTWRLCRDRYPFTPRDVEVKGIGAMRTYLLDPSSVSPRDDPD